MFQAADVRSALHFAVAVCYLNPPHLLSAPSTTSTTTRRRRAKVVANLNLNLNLNFKKRRPRHVHGHVHDHAVIPQSQFNTTSDRFGFSSSLSPPPSVSPASSSPLPSSKPSICTADELHYVRVPATNWHLALWRYLPPPNAPLRNHPLLLLSGVGTNAIGFDLSPGSSFARYMSSQGFDTWILEVRGAGLSMRLVESEASDESACDCVVSELINAVDVGVISGISPTENSPMETVVMLDSEPSGEGNGTEAKMTRDQSQLTTKMTETLLRLAERVSGFLNEGQSRIMSAKFFDEISKLYEDAQLSERFNEVRRKLSGLLETRQSSAITNQIRDLSQRLVNIIEEGQRSVSPQFFDLQGRLYTTIEDFQKQLDLIVKYDWDFDNYLEEDVPAAMEYIRTQCKPKDGKLLAVGHSMGGILLYAMLSRCGFEGKTPGLAGVVTLASSLDYTSSNSSLKFLLPLADPAQALNVPVVPLGALLAAAYPLACRPPYVLSWLNPQVSAEDMMHPELFEKLVLNNFCTIPAKLLLQLTTAFRAGGLRDRSGYFCYKDHLHKSEVPILALAGDKDLICPPAAVYETVKIIPQHMVTYKQFGKPNGPHYGHYDLVGGRLAIHEVYPCIIDFLCKHDQ